MDYLKPPEKKRKCTIKLECIGTKDDKDGDISFNDALSEFFRLTGTQITNDYPDKSIIAALAEFLRGKGKLTTKSSFLFEDFDSYGNEVNPDETYKY